MNYRETAEFKCDFKRLLKKFPSLIDDMEITKRFRIELFHLKKIDNRSIFEIERVGNNKELKFYKIKKFQCKSLKGRGSKSGIRVIYAFHCIICKVEFIEIYFKGNKENENRERIKEYLKNFPQITHK